VSPATQSSMLTLFWTKNTAKLLRDLDSCYEYFVTQLPIHILQYSTVQYSTVQYSTEVWYSKPRCIANLNFENIATHV